MHFDLSKSIEILERTPDVVESLLRNLSEDWSAANEGPDTWSAYDIVGHLIHGEKTDWIPRMKIVLSEDPDKRFQTFDRFAQFRESRGKSLQELLSQFRSLREANVAQLRALDLVETDLGKTGIHPQFGKVTLRQLLSTWVVHDLNHIAQIARVMGKQYNEEVGPWKEYLKILS